MAAPIVPGFSDALVILDFFGIAVFAVSGALLAAQRKLDFVTFVFFAAVTGVGGGTLRDLLIGAPVFWVSTNATLLICVCAALAVWFVRSRRLNIKALDWFDAAGSPPTRPTARRRRSAMAWPRFRPSRWAC